MNIELSEEAQLKLLRMGKMHAPSEEIYDHVLALFREKNRGLDGRVVRYQYGNNQGYGLVDFSTQVPSVNINWRAQDGSVNTSLPLWSLTVLETWVPQPDEVYSPEEPSKDIEFPPMDFVNDEGFVPPWAILRSASKLIEDLEDDVDDEATFASATERFFEFFSEVCSTGTRITPEVISDEMTEEWSYRMQAEFYLRACWNDLTISHYKGGHDQFVTDLVTVIFNQQSHPHSMITTEQVNQ